MRKINLLFATLFLLGGAPYALAQQPPATLASSPQTPQVDPFNGQPVSLEQAQMELAQAKLKTQALEEQLKQAQTQQDLRNLPTLKSVNVSQAKTEVLDQSLKQVEIEQKLHAANEAAAQKRLASRQARKKPVERRSEKQVSAAVAAPAPAAPVLVSVSDSVDRSAVLQTPQGSYLVKDGQQTPFGVLRVLGPSEVRVGNQLLSVHLNTLSQIHAPYVPPKKSPNGSVARFPAEQGAVAAAPGSSREIPPPVVARTVPGTGQVSLPFSSR